MSRFQVYVILLTFGLITAAGCSQTNTRSSTEQRQGEASREAAKGVAFVRYIGAVDAHSNTDLYFGDTRLFSTADAKTATDYKQVPAERRDFVLREAGKPEGAAIEKNSEGLGDGKHYTVVVYEDKDAKPVLRVFNDDESAPAAGKAKVRIIHAAPAVESVDVYAVGRKDKLASESRFTTTSNWQEVDAVNGPLEVRSGSGKSQHITRVPDSRIEAGKLYTLVVEGGTKSPESLHVIKVVDMPSKN
ncbi:MAG: hypothetical protein C5B51_22860 [Terriglobia bacterium]|nr:MAG: hypothetical protein C5B51_22860 [Terriglobia bacterium]